MIGHPKVTQRAYEQDRNVRETAVRFAETVVHNGLGRSKSKLTEEEVLGLKVQIERDLLVYILGNRSDDKG